MAFRLPEDVSRDNITEQVWGLCFCASHGDVSKLISYMYQKDIMLNLGGRIGAGALILATQQGHAKALKTLIAAGADVNVSQSEEKTLTPLMVAAERGDVDCLIALINGGAKVNQCRHDGQPSLAIAIHEGCSDDVRHVIDAKTYAKRPFTGSLVMTANRTWKEQHEECALLLLQAGADVSYTNDSGYSLLMTAAANGSIKTVKSLIQAGANVNQAASDGATALFLACRCTTVLDYRLYKECIDVLLQAAADVDAAVVDGKTALISAVQNAAQYKKKFRRTDIIQLLVQAEANPNAQDNDGKTALMYAAEKNLTSFCEILISYFADVTIRDRGGRTAFMYTTDSQCLKALMFTKYGAANCKSNKWRNRKEILDVECLSVQDDEGKTALMHAASSNSTRCCELLANNFCNFDIQDREGRTALMHATKSDCMDWLIRDMTNKSMTCMSAMPNFNIQDHNGKTALMYAAENKLAHSCRLLAKRHADVNMRDNRGKIALMYCSDTDTLSALLMYRSDPEIRDNSNRTILTHLLKRRKPISDIIGAVSLVLLFGANPVLDPCYHHLLQFHSTNAEWRMETLVTGGQRQFIRLLVCNGFVARLEGESYNSPLCRALEVGHIDIAKYLIACCYLNETDLRDIRKLSTTIYIHNPESPFDAERFAEVCLLVQQILSQPWPLVKLAFIAVSSAVGASPNRNQRIMQTQLPARLQRMLMFQEPVTRLDVPEWSKLPLCFDMSSYENMPRPRPLLYYWPFGQNMII